MPDIFVSKNSNLQKALTRQGKIMKALGQTKLPARFINKTSNRLTALAPFPDGVSFETQGLDEPIVLLLRPHPLTNSGWIILAILLILGPLVLPLTPLLNLLPLKFIMVLNMLWYLLTLSFIFEKFLGWFFNIFIITDERVIDVDFYSFTYKEVSEAALGKIEDISYTTGGLFGSVLDFGTVSIQTAGEKPNIEFENVPHPAQVVAVLRAVINQ